MTRIQGKTLSRWKTRPRSGEGSATGSRRRDPRLVPARGPPPSAAAWSFRTGWTDQADEFMRRDGEADVGHRLDHLAVRSAGRSGEVVEPKLRGRIVGRVAHARAAARHLVR